MSVTEIDITRALDAFYPDECWDVTLGADLSAIRTKMRTVLEGYAAGALTDLVKAIADDPEAEGDLRRAAS